MTNRDHQAFESAVKEFFNELPTDAFETVACPLCYQKEKSHLFNKESMSVVRCRCGLVYNEHQAKDFALHNFYQKSDAMKTWSMLKQTKKEILRQKEKFEYAAQWLVEKEVKSVCDIGCGTGEFLRWVRLNSQNVSLYGFDSHEESVNVARASGIKAEVKGIENFLDTNEKKYEAITLWGVLEHYKYPQKLLKDLSNHLEPGGYLAVCVPNVESTVVKSLWKDCYTFCPQHLWYFDVMTITKIMNNTGFQMVEGYTIEPEVVPVLKRQNGYQPYGTIPEWEEERILSPQSLTRLSQDVLTANRGYKIVFIGQKQWDT